MTKLITNLEKDIAEIIRANVTIQDVSEEEIQERIRQEISKIRVAKRKYGKKKKEKGSLVVRYGAVH